MATITTATGKVIDIDTGEVVGQQEALVPQSKQEIPSTAMDIARQGSYGFNAALFSLPDAGVRAIGRALGLEDKEVVTLTKLFNKGDRGPQNSEERYARAIGNAIGANAPITGVLGYMAKSQKLAKPLMADAGVLKRVAKDTLDFIRKNPKAAFAADIGAGAAFGAAEQYTKEEEMGELAQTLIPLGASIAGPAALGTLGTVASKLPLPGVLAAKYGRSLVNPDAATEKLTQVGREITGEYPSLMRPIVSPLVQRAERKAGEALGQGEIQIALQESEQLIQELGAQGIRLNTAERTMLPYFVKEQGAAVRTMDPGALKAELERRAENMNQFEGLMARLAPKADMSAEQALNIIRGDAEGLQQRILQQIGDEKGLEAGRLADRYTPANQDILGKEIRETILGGGESAFWNLRNVENRMGLRMQFTQDGVPLPTRDANGVSLYRATDIERPINDIIGKYNILTGPIKSYAPGLVKVLGRYKSAQGAKGTNAFEDSLTRELTDVLVQRDRPTSGPGASAGYFREDELAAGTARADLDFRAQQEAIASSLAKQIISPADLTGTAKRPGLADLKLPEDKKFELIAKSYGLNPDQVKGAVARAKSAAEKTGKVDINFPEAVELLQRTTEYRNNALRRFNETQMEGKGRIAAQKELDKANAVHKDISEMLFKAVPKLGKEYSTFRQAYQDIYEGAYERYLPLLMAEKRGTGEFLTSNEKILSKAFESAENMRDIKILLGGAPKGDELMTQATMDWLQKQKILNNEGIIDPKKLQSVLAQKKNIVQALPAPLRQALNDELVTGKAFAARMAQLEARKESVIDAELGRLLGQISREGAEPGPLLERALRNPADMKSLVNAVKDKPELMSALRRGVYNMAAEQFGDKSISTFLDNANKRSLSFLFEPKDLTNLQRLGDLEKRIRVSEGIVDIPKPFETTDEALQRIAGVSIRNLTTMYRGLTGVGGVKPSPMDAGVYLGMRLIGRQEYGIMDRVMQKAISDPDFAAALVANKETGSLAKQLEKLNRRAMLTGVYIPEVIYKAPQRAAVIQGSEALQEPVPQEEVQMVPPPPPAAAPATPAAPQAPRAAQMMEQFNKTQPSAPPTRGMQVIPAAPERNKLPPQAPKSSNAAQMYQALFPNDNLGNLIQQKQAVPGQ